MCRRSLPQLSTAMSKLREVFSRSRPYGERLLITICFLAALGFWFVLKMMQTYEHTRALKIEYAIPESLLFGTPPPKQILVRYRGAGWSLLFSNQKFRQSLKVDYSETAQSISTLQLIRKVADHIGESGVEIINIDPESLNPNLVEGGQIRVPIVVQHDINTIPDHFIDGNIRSAPDSVTVYGPPVQLEGIKSWKTEKIEASNIRDTVRKKTALAWPSQGLSLDTYITDVVIPVTGYTEKIIELPVIIENIPKNVRLVFEPQIVKVFCMTPLNMYNLVDESFFTLEADMDEINISSISATLPVKVNLAKEADFIRNFDYQPKVVEIIFLPSEVDHNE